MKKFTIKSSINESSISFTEQELRDSDIFKQNVTGKLLSIISGTPVGNSPTFIAIHHESDQSGDTATSFYKDGSGQILTDTVRFKHLITDTTL